VSKVKGFFMAYYQDSLVQVFFGDKSTSLDPRFIRGKKSSEFITKHPFPTITKEFLLPPKTYVLSHQVHGVGGEVVTQQNSDLPAFVHEGDYLVTNMSGVGIGVATADCLPLVLVDPIKKAVGIVHAGWKGLIAGVVEQTFERMQSEYGSVLADISCIVGPSAHNCCYEVGKDFFDQARLLRPATENFLKNALSEREGRLFFDSVRFLKDVFFEKGCGESAFDFSYAECTICKPHYCSYRREKMSPLRQITIVSLK
jgi:YfiH family protein